MNVLDKYKDDLHRVMGKTIAIVYIFEGEDAPGFAHYDIWKSDIVGQWMQAAQQLKCLPLVMDVRTFVEKSIQRTLPKVDYVLNLNAGSIILSSMALVPSMASFNNIPCIPCDAGAIIAGENKHISNALAKSCNLLVPKEISRTDLSGIYRPQNFGSSIGVHRGYSGSSIDGLYQEFIRGYDITTPIMYNPLSDSLDILPTIIYLPESGDCEWYFGENEKKKKAGYQRKIICIDDPELRRLFIKLAQHLPVKTFCRIDARVAAECISNGYHVTAKNTYFIEINPMPTIRHDNSFGFSYGAIEPGSPFQNCLDTHKSIVGDDSPYSFLLACSMVAYARATC